MKNIFKLSKEIVTAALQQEVISFLVQNPNPSDADLHNGQKKKDMILI